NVNDDFWLNILVKFAEHGIIHGVYEFDKRIKVLLDSVCLGVKDLDAQKFKEKYPYISRGISQEEVFLSLAARDKACAWLFEQGYYQDAGKAIKYAGNSAVLGKLLFDGKMLYHDINAPNYA
ncbi:integrase, partial [Vibrio anguillarum]|nr:integrase [Vibrio anguillarum]